MAAGLHKTVNIATNPDNPPVVALSDGSAVASKTTLYYSGTKNGNGDNTVVAAPGASLAIVLVSVLLQNTTTNATTMLLKDGTSGSEIIGVLGQNQGDGLSIVWPADARPKLSANTLLNLNLSGANACRVSVVYYTVAA